MNYDAILFTGKFFSLSQYKRLSPIGKLVRKLTYSISILFSPAFILFLLKNRILSARLIINLAYKIKLTKYLENYSGSKTILIEEGPTQLLFNSYKLRYTHFEDVGLRNYMRDIIMVKCNYKTQLSRLKTRGHWRVKVVDLEKFLKFNETVTAKLEVALKSSTNVASLKIIENN